MPDAIDRPAPRSRAAATPLPPLDGARRARVDAVLRPVMLGGTLGTMTARAVAVAARDAAEAILPLLPEPQPSADRVRRLLVPVLTCPWDAFETHYVAALDAVLALPRAVPGVADPAWDADLEPPPPRQRSWLEANQAWTAPAEGMDTVGPGGTAGRVARRGHTAILVTADGRDVRLRAHCPCDAAQRAVRPAVPFEHVHLRRDGSILDVTTGTACGACRAPLP